MMNEPTGQIMTESELEAFAERITSWAAGLTSRERAVWDGMLMRAASPDDEVSGFLLPYALNLPSANSSPMDPMINTAGRQLLAFNQAGALANLLLRKP